MLSHILAMAKILFHKDPVFAISSFVLYCRVRKRTLPMWASVCVFILNTLHIS